MRTQVRIYPSYMQSASDEKHKNKILHKVKNMKEENHENYPMWIVIL